MHTFNFKDIIFEALKQGDFPLKCTKEEATRSFFFNPEICFCTSESGNWCLFKIQIYSKIQRVIYSRQPVRKALSSTLPRNTHSSESKISKSSLALKYKYKLKEINFMCIIHSF